MKDFFKKLGTVLKANLGTVGLVSIETILGSGSAVALIQHILGTGVMNAAASYAVGILFVLLFYVGVVALTIWIGGDSETSAKVRGLLDVLVKVIKNRTSEEKSAILDTIYNDVNSIVSATKETIEAQEAAEKEVANAEADKIKAEKEAAKEQAELLKKAQALLKQQEKEAAKAKEEEKKAAAEAAAKEKAEKQAAAIAELAAKIANGELNINGTPVEAAPAEEAAPAVEEAPVAAEAEVKA